MILKFSSLFTHWPLHRLFTMQNPALTATQLFPIITLSKTHSDSTHSSSAQREDQTPASSFDLSTARSIDQQTMPPTANQTILIYTHIEMLAHYDHVPMAYMNRTNWIPQSPPLITLPISEWDDHQFMPEIMGNGEWVDIIVNNLDKDAGHPFHLVILYPILLLLFSSRVLSELIGGSRQTDM